MPATSTPAGVPLPRHEPTALSPSTLGVFLVVAAVFGLVQVAVQVPPPWTEPWLIGLTSVLGLMGAGLAARPVTQLSRAAAAVVLTVIALVVVALVWLLAWGRGGMAWTVLLFLPVLGGLWFRVRGALVGVAVAIVGIAGHAVMASQVFEREVIGPTIATQVGVAAMLGAFCGVWAANTQRLQVVAERDRRATEAVARREHELAQRLQDLDDLRTAFIAITSHELRTPLTAINGFALTLLREDMQLPREDEREMLAAIRRHAERLSRLVDDLRTASSLDAGTIAVDLRPVLLGPLAREVADTVAPGRVQLEGDDDVWVMADAQRVFQVLANLVGNALAHGGQQVQLLWRRDGDEVETVVVDDGPGIAEEDRDRIFERFQRGPLTAGHVHGRGLGLAISRELCERMGGTLALTDAHAGTGFAARLPWAAPPPERLPETTSTATGRGIG